MSTKPDRPDRPRGNLAAQLAAAGCALPVAEFYALIHRQRLDGHPGWTEEDLLCEPRKALAYCKDVRAALACPKLKDAVILHALVNWRKRGYKAPGAPSGQNGEAHVGAHVGAHVDADLSAAVAVPVPPVTVPADQVEDAAPTVPGRAARKAVDRRAAREAAASPEAVGRDARDVGRHCLLSEFAGVTERMARLLADNSAFRTVGDVLDRAKALGETPAGVLKLVKCLNANARKVLAAACETAAAGEWATIGARVRRRADQREGWVKGTKKVADRACPGGRRVTESYVEWDLLPGQEQKDSEYVRVEDLAVVARAGSPEAREAARAQREGATGAPSGENDSPADITPDWLQSGARVRRRGVPDYLPGGRVIALVLKGGAADRVTVEWDVPPGRKHRPKQTQEQPADLVPEPTAAGIIREEAARTGDPVVRKRLEGMVADLNGEPRGRCRVCGCTQHDCRRCVERTGGPCGWTSPAKDLCSACLPLLEADAAEALGLGAREVSALDSLGFRTIGHVLTLGVDSPLPKGKLMHKARCDEVRQAAEAWVKAQLDKDAEGNELMPDDRQEPPVQKQGLALLILPGDLGKKLLKAAAKRGIHTVEDLRDYCGQFADPIQGVQELSAPRPSPLTLAECQSIVEAIGLDPADDTLALPGDADRPLSDLDVSPGTRARLLEALAERGDLFDQPVTAEDLAGYIEEHDAGRCGALEALGLTAAQGEDVLGALAELRAEPAGEKTE